MSTETRTPAPHVLALRPVTAMRTGAAAVAATAVNLIVFAVARGADVTFDVNSPEPINAWSVVLFSALPLIVAAVVVALRARRRPGFQRFAAWAGLTFAVLTVAGSFGAAGDLGTAFSLAAMHVVVGLSWFAATFPGRASA